MRHSSTLPLSALILTLAACGKGEPEARSSADAPATESPGSGPAATTIHLVIGGGEHAGTYDAKSSDITCTYGFAGPGSWGNQYSVTGKKATEFSSLQLIVPDTKDAADGTDQLLMTVGFGELFKPGYSEHVIDTRKTASPKKGNGTITVDDRKTGGKVSFKGTAGDGTTLEGTIDCHQMMRGDG
jgi:hypothetical protein